MKHLIAYQDVKLSIDGVLPNASHSLYSLVTLFQECDDQFLKLVDEKTTLSENKELAISASELYDAYELVEDGMNTMGMLIANIGRDEQKLEAYAGVSTFIEPAKELIPTLLSMIHTVSSQMSDFIELHNSFIYQDIDKLNPMKVRQYMDVNSKVSRISCIIRRQIIETHEELVFDINEISNQVTATNMVFEANEAVKGDCYVSLIDGISIIEVGETEDEVLKKTREYFDGSMDDTITIKPCSSGIYQMVKHDGEIPEEWEEMNGVIVLPDEQELFEQVQTGTLTEKRGMYRAAVQKVHHDVEAKVKKEFSSRVLKVTGELVDDEYTIKIVPDNLVEKSKFNNKDKRVVLDIYRKLKVHDWFTNVTINELDDGTLTITVTFGNVDINNANKEVVENFSLAESTEKLDSAGFIPYHTDGNSVYVMTMIPSDPDYGGTQPQLAKGKIDDGYDALQTAMKEAEEEVGLKPSNVTDVKRLGAFDYKGSDGTKTVDVYYGEVKDLDDFSEPHWESGWTGWIDITKDLSKIRKSQHHVFKTFLDKFK